MGCIHTKTQSGYEYNLYCLPLDSLKSRLNTRASRAMENGQCKIVWNACMTTVKKGKVQGKMTDNGPSSGSVYMDYNGIAGAASWNSAAKQSLRSYFNKQIAGLFREVRVDAGKGLLLWNQGYHQCKSQRGVYVYYMERFWSCSTYSVLVLCEWGYAYDCGSGTNVT